VIILIFTLPIAAGNAAATKIDLGNAPANKNNLGNGHQKEASPRSGGTLRGLSPHSGAIDCDYFDFFTLPIAAGNAAATKIDLGDAPANKNNLSNGHQKEASPCSGGCIAMFRGLSPHSGAIDCDYFDFFTLPIAAGDAAATNIDLSDALANTNNLGNGHKK